VAHDADFYDERSLYLQILKFSGLYNETDSLDSRDLGELRKIIADFLNEFSTIIILDDIDTLTTKNVEVGTNFLYRMLARSSRVSKILCTQRNIPTHAISNSIEVPGLTPDGEYQEFVSECVKHYGVKSPSDAEDRKLAAISERRPLVVEYIVALLRTTPGYEAAFRLFEGDTGNDIRDYVFRREWTSLSYGPDSRSMLAALAIIGKPTSFADLLVILQFGEGRLRDAVSATRAMFLQINDAGQETTYSLDIMTRDFVLKESENIDYISTLRARIRNFEKSYFPAIPQISRLTLRASDLVRKAWRTNDTDYLIEAWTLVTDTKLSAGISEHPQFKSLLGFVASKLVPPRLNEARAAFRFVFGTKYSPPIEHIRSWFDAEKNSGIGFANCMTICDYVSAGREYEKQDKIDFSALKASTLYYRAREQANDDPNEAVKLLKQALILNAVVYSQNINSASYKGSLSERHLRNTAFTLFDLSLKSTHLDETVAILPGLFNSSSGCFDPLEEPVNFLCERARLKGYEPPVLHRARKHLAAIVSMEPKPELWLDRSVFERIKSRLRAFDLTISATLKDR
jgi:hypothetical protein